MLDDSGKQFSGRRTPGINVRDVSVAGIIDMMVEVTTGQLNGFEGQLVGKIEALRRSTVQAEKSVVVGNTDVLADDKILGDEGPIAV